MPLYHYVLPVTIFESARGAKYGEEVIKMQTKRWDTLAWFLIVSHKGDFEKSFNLGTIDGGFGTSRSGSSKLGASVGAGQDEPPTVQKTKPAQKITQRCDPIVSMPTYLAEYMQLNAAKANLQDTIAKTTDNETNDAIMLAIDFRRQELAKIMKPPSNPM